MNSIEWSFDAETRYKMFGELWAKAFYWTTKETYLYSTSATLDGDI